MLWRNFKSGLSSMTVSPDGAFVPAQITGFPGTNGRDEVNLTVDLDGRLIRMYLTWSQTLISYTIMSVTPSCAGSIQVFTIHNEV